MDVYILNYSDYCEQLHRIYNNNPDDNDYIKIDNLTSEVERYKRLIPTIIFNELDELVKELLRNWDEIDNIYDNHSDCLEPWEIRDAVNHYRSEVDKINNIIKQLATKYKDYQRLVRR